ncbi:phosphate transport system permease protein PstC [Spirochaetota bacterium]|nr:phosphate transport system permease protein PstC [Spirochaetota bacterium]
MQVKDTFFRIILLIAACFAPVLIIGSLLTLSSGFIPAFNETGLSFFWSATWDPQTREFGGVVFLVGTIATSVLALILSFPFSIAISIFTGEIIHGTRLASIIANLVEIISAIPSVVIGLWAIFVFIPIMQQLQILIGAIPYGTGFLTATIVLAFMIIPFSATLGREVITLVPTHIKEAAYAMGATRFEVIRYVILPYARSGIIGGFLISTARAFGETMAVTMLIGNVNHLPTHILSPTNTMASIIANEFAEATDNVYYAALIGIGLLLLISSIVLSYLARRIIKHFIL